MIQRGDYTNNVISIQTAEIVDADIFKKGLEYSFANPSCSFWTAQHTTCTCCHASQRALLGASMLHWHNPFPYPVPGSSCIGPSPSCCLLQEYQMCV